MSDTRVLYKPYIIGPSRSDFVVPAAGGLPSYAVLGGSNSGAASFIMDVPVTIPPGASRVVATVDVQVDTAAGVSIFENSAAFTQDAILTIANSHLTVWSIPTSASGTGGLTVRLTCTATGDNRAMAVFGLNNVTGPRSPVLQTQNTQAAPFIGQITTNLNDVMFASCACGSGVAPPTFNTGTQAPDTGSTPIVYPYTGSRGAMLWLMGSWANLPAHLGGDFNISLNYSGTVQAGICAVAYG